MLAPAVLGSETAREDDVESGVLAGLAILDDARAWADTLRRRDALGAFDVRAGLHAGPALVRIGATGALDLTGASVHLAARMEQSAPPGRLRISHEAFRQVQGLFDVEEQPPLNVKGVDGAVRSYLVVRGRPRALSEVRRGVPGVRPAMIGREAEVAALRAALDAAVGERRARLVTVLADAGLGKSRLWEEFRREAVDRGVEILDASAHPRSPAHRFGVLRDLVARHLRVDASVLATETRQAFVERFGAPHDDRDAFVAPVLGHLIGVDFADDAHVADVLGNDERLGARIEAAADRWIRRIAVSVPAIVAIDDAHWCDDATLGWLARLADAQHDAPLLVLAFARPALLDRRAAWPCTGAVASTLEIAPLDAEASRRLAASLTRDAGGSALVQVLVRAGEGNPFAMEETVNLLIDDGALVQDEAGWRVEPSKLGTLRIPPTLAGVLQSRFDALEAPLRRAAQAAAVIGYVFWDAALAAVEPDAGAALPGLEAKGYVVQRGASTLAGAREYAFKHNLLQQSAYDTLLRAAKVEAHARAGAFWRARADPADAADISAAHVRALAEAHFHGMRADAAVWADWFGSRFFLAGRGTRHRLVVSDDFVTESEIGAIPRLLRLWRTADVLRGRPNNTTHLSKSGLTWSLK